MNAVAHRMEKDPSLIPSGGHCYQVVRLQPGETLSDEIDRFGKDLREFSYHPGYKEVLCPYWTRTDYGTVRCEFLNREVLDEVPQARLKVQAHFGVTDAASLFDSDWALPDEIKRCGHREDENDEVHE
jgi:hypothetical protein